MKEVWIIVAKVTSFRTFVCRKVDISATDKYTFILERVQKDGKTFIIEFGKKHKKVAMLVLYKEEPKKRVFGQLKGTLNIPDDITSPT